MNREYSMGETSEEVLIQLDVVEKESDRLAYLLKEHHGDTDNPPSQEVVDKLNDIATKYLRWHMMGRMLHDGSMGDFMEAYRDDPDTVHFERHLRFVLNGESVRNHLFDSEQ